MELEIENVLTNIQPNPNVQTSFNNDNPKLASTAVITSLSSISTVSSANLRTSTNTNCGTGTLRNSSSLNLNASIFGNASFQSKDSPQNTYFLFKYEFCKEEDKNKYVCEYATEIYENLLQEEKNLKFKPLPGFIERQKEINSKMREILIDWLVDIHFQFKMKSRTLYLAVYLIDTYLSYKQIQRKNYQLLGIGAFLISCKEEEMKPPSMEDLIYLTDFAYTKESLFEMEIDILKTVDFNLIIPLAIDFYEPIAKLLDFNEENFYMGQFFMESYLLSPKSSVIPGSILACACAYIVMLYVEKPGYELCYDVNLNSLKVEKKVIKEIVKTICASMNSLQTSNYSTKRKFSLAEFGSVARYMN